jgi:Mn2+/Fe2+ NRAMP family transporter
MAAVSVGASHLVQSTRAGAVYGLALVLVVVVAMASKYPAYRFCPRYTSITGVSMIEGFARQGSWALILFCISALGTVFVGGAGITMVAAGILKATFSLSASAVTIAIIILIVTDILLIIGRYHWLDLLMKVLMIFLSAVTVIATALVLPDVNWGESLNFWPQHLDLKTTLFIIALFGWMPAPLEAAVMTSLWSQAKAKDIGYRPSTHATSVDFHIGYGTTLLLSLCFMLLGTGLMHGAGIEFVDSAGGFASQVIDLYGQVLGDWTRPFMGIMALSVMYSTVIAHLDGFSRITDEIIWHFEQSGRSEPALREGFRRRIYNSALLVITASVILVILFLMTSFKTLIDVSATIAFVATPVFAIMIHRAMMSNDVPAELRPRRLLRSYSVLCNVFLSLFALGYLVLMATT